MFQTGCTNCLRTFRVSFVVTLSKLGARDSVNYELCCSALSAGQHAPLLGSSFSATKGQQVTVRHAIGRTLF